MGATPTWASCAPAAFRPASIRPIRRSRSNISSTIPHPGDLRRGRGAARQDPVVPRALPDACRRIVVFDMEGLSGFSDPMVMSLAEFMALGSNHMVGPRDAVGGDDRQPRRRTISRSWSTPPAPPGRPRAPCIPTAASPTRCATPTTSSPPTTHEERLVFLPLCHVAERVGGYYTSLALGSVMNFAESPETVPDNLREVQPTAFLAVPRIWEKFYSGITIALKDATRAPALDVPPRDRRRLSHDRLPAGGRHAVIVAAPRQPRRLLAGVPQHPPHDRARPLPAGLHRRGADRAGPDPLVSRARHRHARGLRPDRELRRRDRDAGRSHQARLGRQGRAVGRGRDLAARARS